MSTDDAVATVTSCIRNYYHPKRLAVSAECYEMVLINELIVSGGIQPSGYIPILLVRGDDIVIGQRFPEVQGLQVSRWGAADDAVMFWRPKRWSIHMSLESPVRPGVGRRTLINCYESDRDRLLAALLRLCPNLE